MALMGADLAAGAATVGRTITKTEPDIALEGTGRKGPGSPARNLGYVWLQVVAVRIPPVNVIAQSPAPPALRTVIVVVIPCAPFATNPPAAPTVFVAEIGPVTWRFVVALVVPEA